MNNHDFLVAQALSAIAKTGKVVEVDHDIADNMKYTPTPRFLQSMLMASLKQEFRAMAKFHEYSQQITAQVLDLIQTNQTPWQQPLAEGEYRPQPVDAYNGYEFSGANGLIFDIQGRDDPRWLQYDDAYAAGDDVHVRKGEKATLLEKW